MAPGRGPSPTSMIDAPSTLWPSCFDRFSWAEIYAAIGETIRCHIQNAHQMHTPCEARKIRPSSNMLFIAALARFRSSADAKSWSQSSASQHSHQPETANNINKSKLNDHRKAGSITEWCYNRTQPCPMGKGRHFGTAS